MAEIIINKNDIISIVKSYENENKTFIIKSFIDNNDKKTCHCFINGKGCKIVFYIKKKSVNIIPIGNNIDECNLLIKYVESKGFAASVAVKQFTFSCTKKIIDKLVKYINDECNGIVTFSQNCNIYKFTGYNGDILTLTYYEASKKVMIQGKPFQAYSIVMNYFSTLPEYTFDQIVEINNTFAEINTPSSSIRSEMKNQLGDAYFYLDEALLKSISGTFSFLKQRYSEDYTGCVAGIFKALEGYLKKLLISKFGYKFSSNSFTMFYKINNMNEIDKDTNISNDCKKKLNTLYNLYNNKRNVYLHATMNPSLTRIIPTLKEAQDISDEIIQEIKDSYDVIFQ